MKWFQHDTDSINDSRIKKLKSKFGMEGYGVYFATLELIGRKMERRIEEFGYLPIEWDDEALEMEFGVSSDTLRTIFDYMIQIGLFEKKDGRLFNSKIIERCDDYTSRIVRNRENGDKRRHKVRTLSELSPNNVQPEEKIIEDNRREKALTSGEKKPAFKHISYLQEIPDADIDFLRSGVRVTPEQIRSKGEDLHNYCRSKNKSYSDYRALLRNAIKRDFPAILKVTPGYTVVK